MRACAHKVAMFCFTEQVADVWDYDFQSVKVAPWRITFETVCIIVACV